MKSKLILLLEVPNLIRVNVNDCGGDGNMRYQIVARYSDPEGRFRTTYTYRTTHRQAVTLANKKFKSVTES